MFGLATETFISIRAITTFNVSAVIDLSAISVIKIFVWQSLSCGTMVGIACFVVLIVRHLESRLFSRNRLTRNVGLDSAIKHIGVNLRTVVSFVRTDRLCFKAVFINLCFNSFRMNRAIFRISGRDKNICNQAMLAITGLVTQIMKPVGFARAVHISTFGIGYTLFHFFCLGCYVFRIICLKQAIFNRFFIQPLDIGTRFVSDGDGFVKVVSRVGTDMGWNL